VIKKVIVINPINVGRETFRPPFGLLTVATIFHKRGVEVKWIDADAMRDNNIVDKEIRGHLDSDLIAIGGLHTSYGHIKELLGYLRQNHVNIPVLIGGRVAKTLDYMIWSKIPNVDMVCKQEGEYVVESICNNFPDINRIKGIEYRKNGEIIKNTLAPIIESLDELPTLRWDFLNRDVYYGDGIGYILGSVGCPFACYFCRHPDSVSDKYRVMSIGRLIREIGNLLITYRLRGIVLVDEYFMLNRKRVSEFCDSIKGLGVHWKCTSRADGIEESDIELLRKMRIAGCHSILMGIESGCQAMLDRMNKKLKVDRIERTIKLVRSVGISVTPTFIFGYPGETRETAMVNVDWRLKMGFRGHYFYATPYPGTKLYDDFKAQYSFSLDDEESYIIASPSIKKLTVNLTSMDMTELGKLDRECRRRLKRPIVRKMIIAVLYIFGKAVPFKQKVWLRKIVSRYLQ